MIAAAVPEPRVLAIDPTSSGFGYAVLEGPEALIDWGVKQPSGEKLTGCLESIAKLIDRYTPAVLVIESPLFGKSRRCERVRILIANVLNIAVSRNIRTRIISRDQIRELFSREGARTKNEIANVIGRKLPE